MSQCFRRVRISHIRRPSGGCTSVCIGYRKYVICFGRLPAWCEKTGPSAIITESPVRESVILQEAFQLALVLRILQLTKCLVLDLTDTLTCDMLHGTDLLEGTLTSIDETVTHLQDLTLTL